jgi:hypothetical protein
MAPRLLEKVKSKVIRPRQAASQGSIPAPSSESSQSPLSIPSQSASQPTIQPIFEPAPSSPTSTKAETPPLPSLRERLWNDAYDELKAGEPKLVEAYENILSIGLHQNQPDSVAFESTENEIGRTRETRCRQMQQLVREGLDRTQKQASIKRGIDEGLQAVQAVRGIVDKAVHAAPEAAIAWVGVCLGLEVYMIRFPNRRVSGG